MHDDDEDDDAWSTPLFVPTTLLRVGFFFFCSY